MLKFEHGHLCATMKLIWILVLIVVKVNTFILTIHGERLVHLYDPANYNGPASSRVQRSVEGVPCNPAANSTNGKALCPLAYTACNPNTLKCECDKTISMGVFENEFPDFVTCVPFEYVRLTGNCIKSADVCKLIVPGAFCDHPPRRREKKSYGKCACEHGGLYPNCTVRIGTLCQHDLTCSRDVPNSYCAIAEKSDKGQCACGKFSDGRAYIPNASGTTCLPANCAAKPCQGPASASQCYDIKDKALEGYECRCNTNAKGRSHSLDLSGGAATQVEGICCPANQVPCGDYKKCLFIEDLCNGKVDCEDCSDETAFCSGRPPTNNPQCRVAGQQPTTVQSLYPSIFQIQALRPSEIFVQDSSHSAGSPTATGAQPAIGAAANSLGLDSVIPGRALPLFSPPLLGGFINGMEMPQVYGISGR
ncbi:sortilin-related receptor-like [Paramacrobiotus metropolitanus]|uniref:sortilin-related receptor-like n=1 Tax=Paramacrobiotus metropolitanus TaxID=2943436 RepID=UPI002445B8AA|nr:sortilin-related receptor-like [Paramacrobiotus metropolitanus]